MSKKRQYQTIKKRKKSPIGLIAILIVVFAIIAGGCVLGLILVSNTVGTVIDSAGVSVNCMVSGNDFVVEVLEGGNADDLVAIELQMEGYTIPPGYSLKEVPKTNYPKRIIYEKIVAGVYENHEFSLKGRFTDGSVKTIWMDTIRFT